MSDYDYDPIPLDAPRNVGRRLDLQRSRIENLLLDAEPSGISPITLDPVTSPGAGRWIGTERANHQPWHFVCVSDAPTKRAIRERRKKKSVRFTAGSGRYVVKRPQEVPMRRNLFGDSTVVIAVSPSDTASIRRAIDKNCLRIRWHRHRFDSGLSPVGFDADAHANPMNFRNTYWGARRTNGPLSDGGGAPIS